MEKLPPPQSDLHSCFPNTIFPYVELVRFDKPAGSLYLFFPCLFGLLLVATVSSPIIEPRRVLGASMIFLLGSIMVRGAGCTWNDLVDRDLDRKILRTRHRPIARGAISPMSAFVYTLIQVLIGVGLLKALLPAACTYYSLPSMLLTGIYPFAKRFTHYPQVVLGSVFSWGVVMAFPAFHVALFSPPDYMPAATCLYFSCVAWTLVYDTIYAGQDMKEDANANIKSIAVRHAHNINSVLAAAAAAQVLLLAATGLLISARLPYFVGTCGVTSVLLSGMIRAVNMQNPAECAWWFKHGCYVIGLSVTSGFLCEYCIRLL